ncbi:MAG: pilus assembly PilX family protein, partial [Terriglobales bacterium]
LLKTAPASTFRRQRGVVLFIALIVMVAMSLAAIALIRSVDTTNLLIGNLAFRQSSILPANLAVEQAAAALFSDAAPGGVPAIADPTADLPAENYYASWQNGDDARGIPSQLQHKSNWTLPKTLDAMDANDASVSAANKTQVRYVIERMCLGAGPAQPGPVPTGSPNSCDMLPPKVNPGTTVHDQSVATLSPIPFYRVTIRVDGPQNSTSFLQAMLR